VFVSALRGARDVKRGRRGVHKALRVVGDFMGRALDDRAIDPEDRTV
jgi:hypothetical protein